MQIELAPVAIDRQEDQLRPDALGQQLPRHDITMVLHLGEQNLVTAPDVPGAPGLGDEVDAFGRAAREYDFVRAARVEVFGGAGAGGLKSRRGAVAQFVDTTMDIRIVLLVIVPQSVDDRPRFLRGRRVVQVEQWMSMNLLVE